MKTCSMEKLIYRHQREIRRQLGGDGMPGGQAFLQSQEGNPEGLLQRLPLFVHRQGIALHPHHVKEIGDQPRHPAGFLEDGFRHLPLGLRVTAHWIPEASCWRHPRCCRAASGDRETAS